MRAWAWVLLTAAVLSLPVDFWQIRAMQARLRAGDGIGTIRACKFLAGSGAVTAAGLFGHTFLDQRLTWPAASVWLCLSKAFAHTGVLVIGIAVCCRVFYKRGKALLPEAGRKI